MTKSSFVKNSDKSPAVGLSGGCETVHLVSFLLATVLTIAGSLLIKILPFNTSPGAVYTEMLLFPQYLKPEPAERMIYMFILLIFPVIYILAYKYFEKKNLNTISTNALYLFKMVIMTGICIITSAILIKNPIFLKEFLVLAGKPTGILLLLFLPAVVLVCLNPAINKKISCLKSWKIFVVFDVAAVCFAWQYFNYAVFNQATIKPWELHFDAILYSVSQVYSGKVLLADFNSQYGLYAHFIAPFLKLAGGLNVKSFTILLGILSVLSMLFIYVFLRLSIKNKLLLALGYIALIYYGFYRYRMILTEDPYFQYFPLRTFFPALILMLMAVYFKYKSKIIYYGILAASSVAVLWTPDTGIVVFLSVLAGLTYDHALNFKNRTNTIPDYFLLFRFSVRNILRGMTVLITVILLFMFLVFIGSGKVPDFSRFFGYQMVFYGAGYCMLPMPLLHPWLIYALLTIIGLSLTLKTVLSACPAVNDSRHIKAFFMAVILAAGLFSYYQGRSHDNVFANISYLMFLLLVLYADYNSSLADKLRKNGNKWSIPGLIYMLTLLVFAFVTSASLFSKPNFIDFGKIRKQYQSRNDTYDNQSEMINFIKNVTNKGESILIVAWPTAVCYAETGLSNPLNIPGLLEIVTVKDNDVIRDYLLEKAPGRRIILNMLYYWSSGLKIHPDYVVKKSSQDSYYRYLEQPVEQETKVLKSDFPDEHNAKFHLIRKDVGLYNEIKQSIPDAAPIMAVTDRVINKGTDFTIVLKVDKLNIITKYDSLFDNCGEREGGCLVRLTKEEHPHFIINLTTENGIFSTGKISAGGFDEGLLVVRCKGKKLSLYTNGKLLNDFDMPGKYKEYQKQIFLGYDVDEMLIFNEALNENRMLDLFSKMKLNQEVARVE